MAIQGSIAFVTGVDKYGARPPEGLPCRFAVLTWLESEGSMADPWQLFQMAIPRIAALVAADRVIAEFWDRRRRGIFRRMSEMKVREVPWQCLALECEEDAADRDFPSRFRFVRDEASVIEAETEAWSVIGGPSPYHDSVTVSFFSPRPLDADLRRIFSEEATGLHLSIADGKEPNN